MRPPRQGPVAQLVAHLHGMQGVTGSSPVRSTTKFLLEPSTRAMRLSDSASRESPSVSAGSFVCSGLLGVGLCVRRAPSTSARLSEP